MADAGSAGQGPDSACTAYATSRCTRYRACLPMRFAIIYSSLADCEQASVVTCAAELSAPGTKRTHEVVTACAADSAAQSCGDWLSKAPPSCIVPGLLAVDAGCEFDSQCASTFCSRVEGSWCGVCKARDGAGADCDPVQASCVAGLRCAYGCTTGDSCPEADLHYRCSEAKTQGSACDSVTQCQGGLSCLGGVCTKAAALGQACDPSEYGSCDFAADLSCTDGATCVKNSYVLAGAACNAATATHCSGLGACDGTDGHALSEGPGTCNPPGGEGEACSADKLCRQPALCFGGKCTSPLGVTCP